MLLRIFYLKDTQASINTHCNTRINSTILPRTNPFAKLIYHQATHYCPAIIDRTWMLRNFQKFLFLFFFFFFFFFPSIPPLSILAILAPCHEIASGACSSNLYHLSCTGCNLMAGMVHVTYNRVRVLRVTSRDQTITGFQYVVCGPEVPIV